MSKYDPLEQHLARQSRQELPMTFEEIEAIIGFALPASSRTHRAWWSNNPSNNVMTKAWLAAGFETEQVDLEGRKLVFRRTIPRTEAAAPEQVRSQDSKPRRRHPLFGWMKGTFTIAPGTDLTEPADPDWADIAWGPEKKDEAGKDAA